MTARLGILALFVCSFNLSAQASPYVPLDDIAYQYIDVMMSRGSFRQLSRLERPYTVGSIRDAIDSARSKGFSRRMTGYLNALDATVDKYSPRPRHKTRATAIDAAPLLSDTATSLSFRARGTVNFYATGQTSARRELMRASDANSISPAMTIRVVMSGGPIAGSLRPIIDTRLNRDIEFTGRTDRSLAGRTEDGYLSGQWKYGELFVGRAARNWGPPAVHGLQLGNYAYTYDHLYGRIGTEKLHFATVIARLDDYRDAAGIVSQRYFSIHRLAIRRAAWEIAATESYVYSGPGRGFEPSLANPLNIYSLSWRNEAQEGNLGLGLETSFRSRAGTLAAHVFLDDVQIDRCDPLCEEPSSYGLTLSAEGLPLSGDQRWFASYARVSYLAYRTPNPNERYAAFRVGLGQGFSDFDEIRAGLDLAVMPRTPLRVYIARRRQGEGDYRDPFPPTTDYATTPGIFGGTVSQITRLGVSGASRWRDFEVQGDVGVNRVGDSAESRGVSANGFQGRLKIALEPRWSISF